MFSENQMSAHHRPVAREQSGNTICLPRSSVSEFEPLRWWKGCHFSVWYWKERPQFPVDFLPVTSVWSRRTFVIAQISARRMLCCVTCCNSGRTAMHSTTRICTFCFEALHRISTCSLILAATFARNYSFFTIYIYGCRIDTGCLTENTHAAIAQSCFNQTANWRFSARPVHVDYMRNFSFWRPLHVSSRWANTQSK